MKKILYIIPVLALAACSSPATKSDAIELNDSLFKLNNLTNTQLSEQQQELSFSEMNASQKRNIIVPVVSNELKVDSAYIIKFMTCQFISKQDLSGGFSGFVARVNGDDYEAMFYILLNAQNKITSYFRLSGGLCAGPGESKNGTTKLCPVRYSHIKNSEITTYVITETISENPDNKKSIIDSVTYNSIISLDGKINTTKKDSIRFSRISE